MLGCAPIALRAAKQVARKTLWEESFEHNFRHARQFPAVQRMFDSEDGQEGLRAFAEKRKPRWKNR